MMTFILFIILIGLGVVTFNFYQQNKKLRLRELELTEQNKNLSSNLTKQATQASDDYKKISGLLWEKAQLEKRLQDLEKYQDIVDIKKYIELEKETCAEDIANARAAWLEENEKNLVHSEQVKKSLISEAENFKIQIKEKIESVELFLENYSEKAKIEINDEAQIMLGEYFELAQKKMELSKLVKALENKIQGYSDEYLLPNQAILDDLIDGYDHLDATQRLKNIKAEIKIAIKEGNVADCDYVEDLRKSTAIAFITNAFNSKADVHVARLKHDNVGKLIEALKEDYLLLNNYGQAFRNARIIPSYLALRIEELKWAALILEFKEREREEQREIREQIREEEKARKEYERAIRDAEKEEEILKKAYEKAKKEFEQASDDQKSVYDQKMKDLMSKLHEAEEKNQRALSMAQQTRAGHVYVISNIGSFGENVLKLGMTRRLEPLDRIRELGDASVPFTFDVHAMIYSEDAPTLEKKLHHYFNHERVNKVNYKKEFFKTSLTDVKNYLDDLGIQARFTLKAEALQYRESLRIELMPDKEQRSIEDSIEQLELNQKDLVLAEDEE